MVSFLTPLTGVTREQLEQHDVPLDKAPATLRSQLSKNVILVEQNIAKDVEWFGLKENVDYVSMVGLAALLRVWNGQRRSFNYFSQDHYVSVWFGCTWTEQDTHDAVANVVLSMSLFHEYTQVQHDANAVHAMGERVLAQKPKTSLSRCTWSGRVTDGQPSNVQMWRALLLVINKLPSYSTSIYVASSYLRFSGTSVGYSIFALGNTWV